MGKPARVTSIDVLPTLTAALEKFRGEARSVLDDLDIEIRRILEWIHSERKSYWDREVRKAQEELNRAKLSLQQARMSRRVADHEPPCLDEKRAVEKARRRLEVAQQKLRAVRQWSGTIDRAVDDFQRCRTQFSVWLETDLARAVAALKQMSASLVNYISLEAPSEALPPAAHPSTGETKSEGNRTQP